jgi:inosine-uridine nucleoside N-ribohydrolase
MDLIVETDIGHDPDDFFAICYLLAAGVKIRAILIAAGDPDQIAITKLILKEVGLDIPVGVSHKDRFKLSSGSIHHKLLKKYGRSLEEKPDGMGIEIIEEIYKKYPQCDLFVIGPATSTGGFIVKNNPFLNSITMQGGFLPYSLYRPNLIYEKFENKEWMPTFNLNGDVSSGKNLLSSKVKNRRMVGKNVCHTVLFDKSKIENIKPKCVASSLFLEAAQMYFLDHDSKKFHDPTAACLHIHPEIGTWFKGKTTRISGGWTTREDVNGDDILAEIDQELLWDHLLNFN